MRPGRTLRREPALALPRVLRLLQTIGITSDEITPQLLLTWLCVLAAGLYLAGFVLAGGLRLFFSYPLETQEDASLQVVRQILQGRSIYGPPGLEYVPVIYPPLYFYVSAAVALLTGAGFLPLRLVSLLASSASAALTYRLVARETRSRAAGLVSAGLFVGCTILALDTLDLARVDALGVGLMLGALYSLRTAEFEPRRAARMTTLAGILAGLAILTKQTDALLGLAMFGYLLLWARPRLAVFSLGLGLTLVAGLLVVYAQAGDWLRIYLYEMPRLHVLDDKHVGNFWSDAILPRYTLPLIVGPLFLVGRALRRDWRTLSFYALAAVSLISMAWGGWANRGASFNVLEPAFAALSILFGLAIAEGLSLLAGGSAELRAVRGFVLAACLAQFLIVGYNPRSTVPLRSDGWAGDRLTQAIGAFPGSVFAPGYGEWSRRAAKGDQPAYGSMMELGGAFGGFVDVVGGRWEADLASALRTRRYDYVLLDPTSDAVFLKGAVVDNGYVDSGPLFKPSDDFYLWKTGVTPDARVYVPAERAATLSPASRDQPPGGL